MIKEQFHEICKLYVSQTPPEEIPMKNLCLVLCFVSAGIWGTAIVMSLIQ